jgi:HTH-type transcriptional repressor of NAD biosynthesis genes
MAQITRICLTGPESTGKSLLAERLAAHYGTVRVEEFSRDYAEARGGHLTYDDVETIARGQVALEEAATPDARGLIILDTDIISSIVYSSYCYGGRVPSFAEQRAASHLADLYLLLDVDVPFVPDRVRSSVEHRHSLYREFRAALDRFGARYEVVSGDWDARYARAVAAIDARLGSAGVDPARLRDSE